MRLLHTADWHIGRRLHGFDLTAAQEHAFDQIEHIATTQNVDGIIIAGDLYDRSLPGEEAVALLNQMIQKLNLTDHLPIYAISGNHDSAIRLATGAPWFQATNYYMCTDIAQAFEPVELPDTQLFLLPYFEPFAAQKYFKDDSLVHLDQAVAACVTKMKTLFDPAKKHILVAHFFVAGSAMTDSETQLKVGGLAAVPAATLADFDYVALGHLHGKDALHEKNAQYSGSPVKFSLSEASQKKGVYIIDTDTLKREFIPITPLLDVQRLQGSFEQFMDPAFYNTVARDNYLGLTLTDTKAIPNVKARLDAIYSHIISIDRVNGYETDVATQHLDLAKRDPLDLLADFYESVAKDDLSDQQKQWAAAALKTANGEVQSWNHLN